MRTWVSPRESSGGADRHAPADEDDGDHRQRKQQRHRLQRLAQDRHGEQQRQEGLQQLHLADAHRAAQCQAAELSLTLLALQESPKRP